MKKLIAVLLLMCLLLGCLPMEALAAEKVLYKGEITKRYGNSYTNVYAKMDKDSKVLAHLKPGNKVNVLALYPDWMEVRLSNGKTGYALRQRIDITETVDPVSTPPYPVWPHPYYIEVDRTVEVKADKSADSKTLSTLTAGARLAVIGCEDGWAKVIWWREFGYINTNDLTALHSVATDVQTAGTDVPIAVFSSFYKDDVDRINNLQVACGYISKVMMPGESMNFNDTVSPFTPSNGYRLAGVLKDGELTKGYGGGSCQVSSTLWDTLMQLEGITVTMRKPHGNGGADYLPHGMDASSGRDDLNLIFRNDYDFPIRIDASCHDLCLFIAIYKGE